MSLTSGEPPGASGGEARGALDVLAEAARARLEAFSREHAGSRAELFLSEGRRLSLEYEASTGAFTVNQGGSLLAAARVWEGERSGFASLPVSGPEELSRVLTAAAQRMGAGPASSPFEPPAPAASSPLSFPEPSAQRTRERAEHLLRTVMPSGHKAMIMQDHIRLMPAEGDGSFDGWAARLSREEGREGFMYYMNSAQRRSPLLFQRYREFTGGLLTPSGWAPGPCACGGWGRD
ncbi:MAG TPA: hypothetical protein VEU33_46845 [Archangium sp.]|nr:hypothetical protein [Archangium sp.]